VILHGKYSARKALYAAAYPLQSRNSQKIIDDIFQEIFAPWAGRKNVA
jgi:hypothetical protein